MPIIIPKGLPAYKSLSDEKIFVMDEARAVGQDIRPIEIAILNLMPTKETTETQLIRLLQTRLFKSTSRSSRRIPTNRRTCR